MPHSPAPAAPPMSVDKALAEVRAHLEKVAFGSITITIHDGKVVQLDVTEKRRLA